MTTSSIGFRSSSQPCLRLARVVTVAVAAVWVKIYLLAIPVRAAAVVVVVLVLVAAAGGGVFGRRGTMKQQ